MNQRLLTEALDYSALPVRGRNPVLIFGQDGQ